MEWEEQTRKVKLDSGYRIAIPSEFREAMGAQQGDFLLVTIERPGVLKVRTYEALSHETYQWLSQYIPPGVSVVDEFIAERRAEAARDEAETTGGSR